MGEFESIMVGEHNLYNQVALVATMEFLRCNTRRIGEGLFIFSWY